MRKWTEYDIEVFCRGKWWPFDDSLTHKEAKKRIRQKLRVDKTEGLKFRIVKINLVATAMQEEYKNKQRY